MKTFVGLGNPGEKYQNTRHNIGFIVLEALAKDLGLTWSENKKFNAEIAKNNDVLLLKPMSYMNNSGQPTAILLYYYKIIQKKYGLLQPKDLDLTEKLTLIHDDIDIDLGKYKLSENSGSAGHRGVQSIINHLKTKNFRRLRIGIRTEDHNNIPTEKFVLQKFADKEMEVLKDLMPEFIKTIQK